MAEQITVWRWICKRGHADSGIYIDKTMRVQERCRECDNPCTQYLPASEVRELVRAGERMWDRFNAVRSMNTMSKEAEKDVNAARLWKAVLEALSESRGEK